MTEVSTHRTVEVPIAITCPTWCVVTPEEHLAELWNNGGNCIHWMEAAEIVGDPDQSDDTITCTIATETRVDDGTQSAPPVIRVGDKLGTLAQALDLADEIRRQVELFRSTGGVE